MRGLLWCGLFCLLLLAGCAANSQLSNYTRTDGRPIDAAQEQATMAQCKGEGVSGAALTDGTVYGAVAQANKEKTLIDACMARNGYIQAR